MDYQRQWITLNPNYTYLMLDPQMGSMQRFKMTGKGQYLYIRSNAKQDYHWTALNGIAMLAKRQASRFVIEFWENAS